MNDDRLIEKLAVQVLGWKPAPGRFIKSGREWTPRWRFAPLTNLEQAFELLDLAAGTYIISASKAGSFEAAKSAIDQVAASVGWSAGAYRDE